MMLRTTRLILARPAIRPATRAPAPAVLRLRALSATAGRPHKETLMHDIENVEHDIEKLKEDSLKMQKQGKGEWMAGLASESEESVKADQDWDPAKKTAGGAQAAPAKTKKP